VCVTSTSVGQAGGECDMRHHRAASLRRSTRKERKGPSTLLMRRPNEDGPCQISLMALAMAWSYGVQVRGLRWAHLNLAPHGEPAV
jgi:hypothetical protein